MLTMSGISLRRAFSFIYHNLSPANPSGVVEINDFLTYKNIRDVQDVDIEDALTLVRCGQIEDQLEFCLAIDEDDSVLDKPIRSLQQLVETEVVDEKTPLALISYDRDGRRFTDLVIGRRAEILENIRNVQGKVEQYDSRFPLWAEQRRSHPVADGFEF